MNGVHRPVRSMVALPPRKHFMQLSTTNQHNAGAKSTRLHETSNWIMSQTGSEVRADRCVMGQRESLAE